jgi:membrane fusion protein (multidrug efflux system)
VQVVQSLDSQWVVTDGLQPGERIIVEGLQKVRPGASVQAEEVQGAPATAAAPAAAPAAN